MSRDVQLVCAGHKVVTWLTVSMAPDGLLRRHIVVAVRFFQKRGERRFILKEQTVVEELVVLFLGLDAEERKRAQNRQSEKESGAAKIVQLQIGPAHHDRHGRDD